MHIQKTLLFLIIGVSSLKCTEDPLSMRNDYAYYVRVQDQRASLSKKVPYEKPTTQDEKLLSMHFKSGISKYLGVGTFPASMRAPSTKNRAIAGGVRVFNRHQFLDFSYCKSNNTLGFAKFHVNYCEQSLTPTYLGGGVIWNSGPKASPSVAMGKYITPKSFMEVSYPFTVTCAYEF